MSVRDANYVWTESAMTLDNELESKLHPILEKAVKNGMELEDVSYIVIENVHRWIFKFILIGYSELMR